MSRFDWLPRASLVVCIDENDELQIIKNRYGGIQENTMYEKQAIQLISRIVSNSIVCGNEQLKLFSESIKNELIEKCTEILKKYGR